MGIVLLFVLSCLWPCIRRRTNYFRTTSDIVYDIEDRLTKIEYNMKKKEIQLDRMETILMEIKEKVVTVVNATT